MASLRKHIVKKSVGSYPFVSVVLSLLLASFIVGVLVLGTLQSQHLLTAVKSRFQLQVVVKKGLNQAQKDSLSQYLTIQPWVAKTDSAKSLRYISKEQAAINFVKETGEDFAGLLEDNPLHDIYELRVDASYTSKTQVDQITTLLKQSPYIYEVVYESDLLNILNSNLNKITMVLLGLILIVGLGVGLLISNTIRLAMFSQRFLIRSMQLVGASPWFIVRPFVMRALFHSSLAVVFAWLILSFLYQLALNLLPELDSINHNSDLIIVAAVQLASGLSLGAGGAYFAVRRYLNVPLDHLY